MAFFKQYLPWVVSLVLASILVSGYVYLFAAPSSFISGTTIEVVRGTSVSHIASDLAQAHIIAHPTLFRAVVRLTGEGNSVQTGLYKFDVPQNLFTVIYRLANGIYGIPPARITFIEGVTLREAAIQVASALPGITAEEFLTAAEGQEGYLFPDTYFFQPGIEVTSVVATMRKNFDTKIASVGPLYTSTEHSLADIVTMASLVEKEARTIEDKHLVAGILWNRIRLGMPLQVDAVFGYIFGRPTYSPSPADLQVKSPYNTYLHTGLPPTPINNPGLDSLKAAIAPTKTNYLYYLTGNDGLMYYAATYAGHQANLRAYLK
jgi:UPF0755 protein